MKHQKDYILVNLLSLLIDLKWQKKEPSPWVEVAPPKPDYRFLALIGLFLLCGMLDLLVGVVSIYLIFTLSYLQPPFILASLLLAGIGMYQMFHARKNTEKAIQWRELSYKDRGKLSQKVTFAFYMVLILGFLCWMILSPEFATQVAIKWREPVTNKMMPLLWSCALCVPMVLGAIAARIPPLEKKMQDPLY